MSIDVQCRCGKTLKVPDAMAGKRGRCKACGATLIVPDAMIDDDAAAFEAFVAVLGIVIAVTMAGEHETSSAGAVGASFVAYAAVGAFAGCLGSITLAALIYMLVDIGRSLRGINQRGGG